MEQLTARSNLLATLKRVERNGGAPGVDGVPTERLRDQIRAEWERIQVPTVLDRLIQQALTKG